MDQEVKPIVFDDILDFGINFSRKSEYEYKGIKVPRVTHIIKACSDSSGLVDWAGYQFPAAYKKISTNAKLIGTETHLKIDNFLKFKFGQSDSEDIPLQNIFLTEECIDSANIAYGNFKLWYDKITSIGYPFQELVGLEVPISCPWYGGTADGIVKIGGLYYIIDFKTSNKMSNEYLIQTAAYMWAINNYMLDKLPMISGLGIIRVSKKDHGIYEDLFINNQNQFQSYTIYQLQECFCKMVDVYYRTFHVNDLMKSYNKDYKYYDLIGGE